MRKFRWKAMRTRFAAASLAAVLLIALSTGGWAASPGGSAHAAAAASDKPLTDIAGHWGKAAIEWAVEEGIVDGYLDGTFKPDRQVSEAEFLAMLIRAYAGTLSDPSPTALWHEKYYTFAAEMRWPVEQSRADTPFQRGQAARLLAASQGKDLDETEAVRYLLDNGLAQGKTSSTVEGFQPSDTLTRAEAVQFIRNLKGKAKFITGLPEPEQARAFAVRGVSLGDAASAVQSRLGQPARIDPSEYGFEWHIYNQDYANYAQIGIRDGKVVALFANSNGWTSSHEGIGPGKTAQDVVRVFGEPLTAITKGFTRFMLNNPGEEEGVYELDESYVTFYYDTHENKTLEAILVIDKSAEEAKKDFYGEQSEEVRVAYEKQVFDLANAARVKRGLQPFQWDDQMAAIAYKHSEDMAVNGYFGHVTPAGSTLQDRFEAEGVRYSMGAENIAAGQPNAIAAHSSWLNSKTGHRDSLLGSASHLGVGVYFGGKMKVYYTQNFYTPLRSR